MRRILIMGLPGSGKTTFAKALCEELAKRGKTFAWFNGDEVRNLYNDHDFSIEGRLRQADRMRTLSKEFCQNDFVICDFVAPLKEMRLRFSPDYIIWLDTEKSSIYEDTDKLFERPTPDEWNVKIHSKAEATDAVIHVCEDILSQS